MTKVGPDIGQIILSPSENITLHGLGYRVMRKLGEGSYAKVYLSEFTNNKSDKVELLACKIVDTHRAPKDFVYRFLPRELEVLARLEHPYVIFTQSIYQRRSKYFIFMAYGTNGDLLEFILKNGPLSEPQSRIWFRQISLAVQYMHEMEFVHRDLKCENVLISQHNNMKLADFGFARRMIDSNGKRVLSETFCGSLSYAAPEILKGLPYNPKFADCWSLGAILYVMLNKAMPFDDANVKRLYEQQTSKHWKFRARIAEQISPEVKKLVSCLLEPDSNKRYKLEAILKSEWMAQDTRLIALSEAEQAALTQAQILKKTLGKKPTVISKRKKQEESLNIIKPVTSARRETSQENRPN